MDPELACPKGPVTSLWELARLFTRLGFTAFGGPAAHIAMIEDEVVSRRRWLSRRHFLDLIGATSLIPGPNSTEMVLHVGYERRGWPGMGVAGLSFLLPAVALTTLLAFLYVRYGTLPAAAPLLAGVQPVVLVLILSAVWKLGRKALRGWGPAVIGIAVAAAALAGLDPTLCLFAGALLGAALLLGARKTSSAALSLALPSALPSASALEPETAAQLLRLGLFFLKVGAVLYGSGYVLVAFLEDGLVQELGWISEQQLLDAIAMGQLTPGPVLSTAAFVGFLVAGFPGAGVAAAGIFLPSFFFVALLNPLIPRLRGTTWSAALLDAVNASALALMAAVLLQLGAKTLISPLPWLLALAAAVALFRFRVASPWLIVGGAGAGLLFSLF